MGGQSIVVQPFGGYQETQIEFCDTRGWGVSQQCDRANVYGFHAGDYQDTWKQAWTPVPVQGDLAGYDRPGAVGRLRVDDRACTCSWTASRRRAPCCRRGACRRAPVTVAYRAVLYHCGIDETVTPDDTGHKYEHDYSLCHSDRHMDDFGIELSVAPRRRGTRRCCPAGPGGMAARERRRRARALSPCHRRAAGVRRRTAAVARAATATRRSGTRASRPRRRAALARAALRRRAAARRSEQPRRRRSGRARLRPAPVLRAGVLGPPARRRQRRHRRDARARRATPGG